MNSTPAASSARRITRMRLLLGPRSYPLRPLRPLQKPITVQNGPKSGLQCNTSRFGAKIMGKNASWSAILSCSDQGRGFLSQNRGEKSIISSTSPVLRLCIASAYYVVARRVLHPIPPPRSCASGVCARRPDRLPSSDGGLLRRPKP